MESTHAALIARETGLAQDRVAAVAGLLAEGGTVPFIARYRKEATGSLDEVAVTAIRDRLSQLAELDARRQTVLKSMEQRGHLTDELREKVESADTLAVLEDIYLPYRPKRRTRATMAREKGLAPLADRIFAQNGADPEAEAAAFVDAEKGVADIAEALSGARDIMAEAINEDETARARMRKLFSDQAVIRSHVLPDKQEAGAKYRDYFEWEERLADAPSHRVLAMRRGEKEDILGLSIAPPEEEAIAILEELFLKSDGPDGAQARLAIADSYRRLLSRSMETEIRLAAKERADAEAIRVFAENLRELLLAPPLGARRVMGVDPGFRTGCKVVCMDLQGKPLTHDTIYLHQPEKAAATLKKLAGAHEIEAIAIGNGTAGRETEALVRAMDFPTPVQVVLVNESGASIYSASEIAREEFPDLDLTIRGSISIGRRLMDPLSELVKIDPKSIGVGQYQHDVDQGALKKSLDDVVVSCVNNVGVDVNRASVQLLSYVSGLGPQLARNIVAHRNDNGPFPSRKALKKVQRLGPKAFEQCAGFLRIRGGEQPLDASAVHPERYPIVEAMARRLDCAVPDMMADRALRNRIALSEYVTDDVGMPTLTDIMAELEKPGRDPRDTFEAFAFDGGVREITDLLTGMKLPGIVTNVTAFGAFVDVGVHQDGLVHVSELADRFVKDPAEVVRVRQKVEVTVLDVDVARKRISLSMRSNPGEGGRRAAGADAEDDGDGRTRPGDGGPAGPSRQDKARPGKARPGKARPGKARPGKARPGKDGPGKGKPGGVPGRERPQDRPFNNPFADLFGGKNDEKSGGKRRRS